MSHRDFGIVIIHQFCRQNGFSATENVFFFKIIPQRVASAGRLALHRLWTERFR
jgi:hypothetical protein